jgi:DNA polymerase-3 subunit delta
VRIYPEKLAADLARELRPVYLVSGDEPLLVQESADQVRAAARAAGCTERQVFDAGERSFDWLELAQGAGSMSLFAERRLLELRIPSGKPGTEGSKALQAYLESAAAGADDPAGGDVLLIVAGRIDKASTSSKWYRAIDAAGATVTVWPPREGEMPRWLAQRAGALGMQVEREALELLAERVEGNLLAAVQELEKLRLLAGDGPIDAQRVGEAVSDNARYNLFACVDACLAGRVEDGLRMLQGLRAEGAEPTAILWAFARELRLLHGLSVAIAAGQSPGQAMNAARVWQSRAPVVQAALGRHHSAGCARLLRLAQHVDGCAKGYADGDPWNLLELLALALAGHGEAPLPLPV